MWNCSMKYLYCSVYWECSLQGCDVMDPGG
jgi:hypothetical protein